MRRITKRGLLTIALWYFVGPAGASAASCLPFIPKGPTAGSFVSISATTMNSDHVVSYATGVATAVAASKGTAAWQITTGQFFSDRFSGGQPFLAGRTDGIEFYIPVADSPKITATLLNDGYAKSTFKGTCSPDGIIHGTTSTVEYLIGIKTISGSP